MPDDIETWLALVAAQTGRTKTALAREAIVEYIDDLEDLYPAEARARMNRKAVPMDELERELGLAD